MSPPVALALVMLALERRVGGALDSQDQALPVEAVGAHVANLIVVAAQGAGARRACTSAVGLQ